MSQSSAGPMFDTPGILGANGAVIDTTFTLKALSEPAVGAVTY